MNTERLKMTLRRVLPVAGILAGGMFLGWLLFAGPSSGSASSTEGHAHEESTAETIWTCSMHPQIRQQEPGLCPICAMELIPLDKDAAADSPDILQMTEEAVAAANIRTVPAERGMPFREIRLPGKVQPDESRQAEITARVAGRVEKLYVNVTGQQVRRGDKLAAVYSPELIAAQKELLEAAEMEQDNPAYVEATRGKLRYWGLSDGQIARIESSGEVQRSFDILAPQGGTVLMRHVTEGDYVREGESLFAIADLSRVWLQFDAYESDLAWLRTGMPLRFTVAGQPGREYEGRIAFIDPVIDPSSRVARVRVEMANPGGALKPEMFATGVVKATIAGNDDALIIPRSAVLWTGTRSVVWVRDNEAEQPTFQYREIRLGAQTGDSYVVEEGLAAGEEVVAQGAFTIDAAAQLQGKVSMMNPAGGPAPQTHDHGGENASSMDASSQDAPSRSAAKGTVAAAFRRQLLDVFDAYERVTQALIASDASAVPAAVAEVRKSLADVNPAPLSAGMKTQWAELQDALRKSLDALRGTRDIEKQRAYYSGVGSTLYQALKHFGVEGRTVYRQYCPMAFDDRGAYWLSSKKDIANPYFGDAMLKCGVTKEELGGQ
ncbi:MAG: efflux RND transporter periplasmic adaptor subunit [Bacteroidota bacterium]|nr:efflux RND transporter periplasmic adaptor subunit [Bacteroidota bacterium]